MGEYIVYCASAEGVYVEVTFKDDSPQARVSGRVELSKAEMNRRLDEVVRNLREQISKRIGD